MNALNNSVTRFPVNPKTSMPVRLFSPSIMSDYTQSQEPLEIRITKSAGVMPSFFDENKWLIISSVVIGLVLLLRD